MNIALLGFMGTGKTSVGKMLAERLGMRFVEMDAIIEEREGMRITKIFQQKGESYFRKLEEELVKELMEMDEQVISCGGGVVINPVNIERLKQGAIPICLRATPETIYERTKDDKTRPLLLVEDPMKRIEELLNLRRPFYEQIPIQIDTDEKSIEEVTEEIISHLHTGSQNGLIKYTR